MDYYEMIPFPQIGDCHFEEPKCDSPRVPVTWRFTSDQTPYLGAVPLPLKIFEPGPVADVSSTAHGTWLVTPEVGAALGELLPADEVQRVPCIADDGTLLEVLNVLAIQDCLDLSRCRGIKHYHEKDRERAGRIQYISHWRIDPERVGLHHMFRIKTYHLSLIISGKLMRLIKSQRFRGVMFRRVD